MLPDEIAAIVSNLLIKARSKQIAWASTKELGLSHAQEDFMVNLPRYSINIYRVANSDTLYFGILNSEGSEIAEYEIKPAEKYYATIRELLDLATLQSSKYDDAIAYLRSALENEGILGEVPEEEL